MTYQELLINGPEGRVLEAATLGDPSGRTVFFHHGTPGSALSVRTLAAVAEHGMFVVAISRPGYGASTRRDGRRVADVVADVRVVLDELGRTTYASVGWSGGGPHALACAALDAPRCVGAWSIAGVVPTDADIDWTAGMGPENIEEFALALAGGPAYEAHMAAAGTAFAGATAENVVELFGGLLSGADLAAMAPLEVRTLMAMANQRAFANGWRGFYDDDRAMLGPWGFDPTAITAPVSIWYGDQDLMVPPTHGGWLAHHLPTATVHHVASEGHISIVTAHVSELADELASTLISS